ncbi:MULTISPECIES: gas vesicle protein GvpG [Rhabdothermincola]|uniref:gas vesicle protein GvpG n=1 Tax=Rhabdothermincola TaxID=2820403 RepID=UPI001AA082A9|nr:hypothetical protein [Rhabdothermincola sediminis]
MATRRSSFEKRERDKNKKARAAAKRERRQDRSGAASAEQSGVSPATPVAGDQQAVLDALAALHTAYDDGRVTFEDFEEQRAELLSRLDVS